MNGDSPAPNYDRMTPAQFEHVLPELFASGSPHINADPQLQGFLARNPDCAALVRDLEAIAQAARDMFQVEASEPSDAVWSKIKEELGSLDSSTRAHTE